jgi:hypothetical protein
MKMTKRGEKLLQKQNGEDQAKEKLLQRNKNWNEDKQALRETNNEKNLIGRVASIYTLCLT